MDLRLAAILLAVALAVGCASKEERLFTARRDNRAVLDGLYARYGGGPLAAELQHDIEGNRQQIANGAGTASGSANELLKMMGNAVGEVDRVAFDAQCEAIGRGERPGALNDKARAFFAATDVIDSCGVVATNEIKINELEVELGLRSRPAEQ